MILKNILIQTHYTFNLLKGPHGGLELHIEQIVLNDNLNNYFIFMPDENSQKFILSEIQNGKVKKRHYWSCKNNKLEFSNLRYQAIVKEILISFKIDLVHIHNFIGHYLDTPQIAKKLGINVLKSVHDMYDIAGQVFQNNFQTRFNNSNLTNEIFFKHTHLKPLWIEAIKCAYDNIDLVIFFSESTQKIYNQFFDIPKYQIIEHGISFKKQTTPLGQANSNQLLYLGRISKEKQVDKIIEILEKQNYQLNLIGNIESEFNSEILKKDFIIYHGNIKHEQLIQKITKIRPKFVIITSNWPETFNYVLSEMIQLGVYPIVTNQGALPERVKLFNWGIIVNQNREILEALNKDISKQYIDWSKIKQHKLIDEMVAQYQKLYITIGENKLKQVPQLPVKNTKVAIYQKKYYDGYYFLVRKFIKSALWNKYLRKILKKEKK